MNQTHFTHKPNPNSLKKQIKFLLHTHSNKYFRGFHPYRTAIYMVARLGENVYEEKNLLSEGRVLPVKVTLMVSKINNKISKGIPNLHVSASSLSFLLLGIAQLLLLLFSEALNFLLCY